MTDLHIYFHGLHLTLDCEWTCYNGCKETSDCPGEDPHIEIGTIRYNGDLVTEADDEMVELLEIAAEEWESSP